MLVAVEFSSNEGSSKRGSKEANLRNSCRNNDGIEADIVTPTQPSIMQQADGPDKHGTRSSINDATPSTSSNSSHLNDSSAMSVTSSTSTSSSPLQRLLPFEQTRWLRCSKGLVCVVLVLAAVLSAVAVYVASSQEEEATYETRFKDISQGIQDASDLNALAVVETYESIAMQMTTYEHLQNTTWPFVTMPMFERQAAQIYDFTQSQPVSLITIVKQEEKAAYEEYVANNTQWIDEAYKLYGMPAPKPYRLSPTIFAGGGGLVVEAETTNEEGLFAPFRHVSPIRLAEIVTNYDGLQGEPTKSVIETVLRAKTTVFSYVNNLDRVNSRGEAEWPSSFLASPIFDTVYSEDPSRSVRAVLTGSVNWHIHFLNVVAEGIDEIYLVVRNTCNQEFTLLLDGPDATYLGVGDLHENVRGDLEVSYDFTAFKGLDDCVFTMHLFPSQSFYDRFHTSRPLLNTGMILLTFFVTAMVFLLYDFLVERRQRYVMRKATRSDAIISSLFPANVRDRLLDDAGDAGVDDRKKSQGNGKNKRLSDALIMEETRFGPVHLRSGKSRPIADLFPQASVLFADIVGFTAWSSMREPEQVFALLEAVYRTFDRIARRLDVFKVETVGDCYVAATGLPEPRLDHAVVMVRFARTCLGKLVEVTRQLSVSLGPDTGTLRMRFGIHSGPVTAGVIRGEKSRFQLFGDTVNTASRIESTGVPGKIHISQETADELITSGRASWILPRKDRIEAKGKGELQTYWIAPKEHEEALFLNDVEGGRVSKIRRETSGETSNNASTNQKLATVRRLSSEGDPEQAVSVHALEVQWICDVLKNMVRKILAVRNGKPGKRHQLANLSIVKCPDSTVLDEVQEVIKLPDEHRPNRCDPLAINLGSAVESQIEDYVKTIASMYRENPFHSFSHATHVVQSTVKLLSRVVRTDEIDYKEMCYKEQRGDILHKYTYGITSDPITQFACVFAALIHDVDHCGVPNQQLVKEKTRIAEHYKNKSVAEQNSLDLAWDLLMDESYRDLCACIFTTQDELNRFRQLLVNSVMATDIMDKELGALRKARWAKAFDMSTKQSDGSEMERERENRMATIVIEHLIQASDVSHTMQHWHVYRKWNERLFHEMYRAYKQGRADKDPSENWYEGELGFFDFYVIPLAKKLKECGVFGVFSDEYLVYAHANRQEWETVGRDAVKSYLANFE